jgi:formyltetrahydrofolate deformylase
MSEVKSGDSYTLVISCPDGVGIVAAISNFVAERGGSLLESNHHTDVEQGWFYMRNVISRDSLSISLDQFRAEFAPLAAKYDMDWKLRDNSQLQRVVIMASHASHCLADILHRWKSGDLFCDIPCLYLIA